MEWIIDRIEEGKAIVECDGKNFQIGTEFLPPDAGEGTVIKIDISKTCENEKKAQARAIMNRIFKK